MAFNTDQRIEHLHQAIYELATAVAEIAKDREVVERMSALAYSFAPPDSDEETLERLHPWQQPSAGMDTDEDDPPYDDLTTPARPA